MPAASQLLDRCLLDGANVLAGFDFRIGIPADGRRTHFKGFLEALANFGQGEWSEFYLVAEKPEEISLRRPFYPAKSQGGSKRIELHRALGVSTDD